MTPRRCPYCGHDHDLWICDLFCCQGGAAMGYHRAGFGIVGVDIEPQPRFPFTFIQADALAVLESWDLSPFAAITLSPPCQFKTQMAASHRSRGFDHRPDLLTPARELVRKTGKTYVIENVPGARRFMQATLQLHGGMFRLEVHRPRIFESNALILAPMTPMAREPVGVYGTRPAKSQWTRLNGNMKGKRSVFRVARSLEEAQRVMGMPWADWDGCKEAVPPAYTEHIGLQLREHVLAGAA